MKLNDFLFVFDLFTVREIQRLETDRMKLTNTYPNKHRGSTSFTFSTDDDFVMVISVSLSKIHHVFSFWLGLDLVDKNGHNILTNRSYPFNNYLEEIESIAIFLQQKKIEMEQCIQKELEQEKALRLTLLMNPEKLIRITNHAENIYRSVKERKGR